MDDIDKWIESNWISLKPMLDEIFISSSKSRTCGLCFQEFKFDIFSRYTIFCDDCLDKFNSIDSKVIKSSIYSKAWCKSNEFYRKSQRKNYYNNNKEKIKSAFIKKCLTSISGEQFEILKHEYSYRCQYCGRKEPEIKLTLDHIVPISKGGDKSLSNLTVACESCNKSKRNKKLILFLHYNSQRQKMS